MSWFVKSHINFASLGRSLNFGQSSPIVLNMISLLSMYNGQLIANQSMVSDNTECWLSSIEFILQKLNIQHTGIKLNKLARSVRKTVYTIIDINLLHKYSFSFLHAEELSVTIFLPT
jgi:hypothetical protein